MVSLDWNHDIASVLDENERLKRRTERQAAIIRLWSCEHRLPDGAAKAKMM
ncbi:MAG: hypothetical protein WBG86_10535 [Polyangiales bacterium]